MAQGKSSKRGGREKVYVENESDMDLTDCEVLQESDSDDGTEQQSATGAAAVPLDIIDQMVRSHRYQIDTMPFFPLLLRAIFFFDYKNKVITLCTRLLE